MRLTFILSSALALTLSNPADAQLIRSAGLKLGASAASQDWRYSMRGVTLDAKTIWGIDVGGFVEWFNLPVFSVSMEAHYIQKGFEVTLPVSTTQSPDGNGTFKTTSARVNYFSIPALVKCRLDLGSSTLYALGGPRVDFLLSYTDEGFAVVFKDFRSSELGLTIGIGLEAIPIDRFRLGAEFRYSPTVQDSYSTNFLTVRNRSLELLLVLQIE
ncbi:MAG: outer membrane beta-barrel protein [Acidobacteriota bacterium]